MITLRPHHLLCIRNFIGKGYSKDFVDNMKSLINTLEENPNQKVLIKSGFDDICKKCPENNLGKCNSEDKVNILDKKVIECVNIQSGDIFSWEELMLKTDKAISREYFEKICSNCSWFNTCKNIK